jgi:hypothetical protein
MMTPEQQATMHLGMQSLYAPAQHLRPTREIGDVAYGQAGFAQQFGSAAGGKYFNAQGSEPLCKIHDASLIENTDERALDSHDSSNEAEQFKRMGDIRKVQRRKIGELGERAKGKYCVFD